MNAFAKFNKGMLALPVGWKIWNILLVAHNMIVPLFYFGRVEAQVVFVTVLASMALMILITARTGFTRLLGLGHILWVPLLLWMWTRLPQIPADDFFVRSVSTSFLRDLIFNVHSRRTRIDHLFYCSRNIKRTAETGIYIDQ